MFCSQAQLRAAYLGHKTELPAPAPQPLTLCVCQGCHTFHKSQPRAPVPCCQSLLPAQQGLPALCSAASRQGQTQRGQDMLKPLEYQHGAWEGKSPFPNCLIPEQTDFQVFSSTAITSTCTSTWPTTLSYSEKVSKTLQKITR